MKIFFIVSIFGDSHCKEFFILGDFFNVFFFLKFCCLRFFHSKYLFNAHLEA